MKTSTTIAIIGGVIIASVAGAAFIYVYTPMTGGPTYTPKTVSITEQDNNTTVTLMAGDSVNLTLKDYGDGGYQWNITSIDDQMLRLDNTITWGGSGMPGDFGNDTWIFTVLSGGKTTLRLECTRPGDDGETCATMTVTIHAGWQL